MISAFGVEHIQKSFVNGRWIPATKLKPAQLSSVARGGHYKAARGVKEGDRKWLEERKTQIPLVRDAQKQLGQGIKTTDDPAEISAGTVRIGGKSSGESVVFGRTPKGETKRTQVHEAQHAKVKRSSYRLHRQILGSPKKTMREEARADYMSRGHYSTGKEQGSTYATAARALRQAQKNGSNATYQMGSRRSARALRQYKITPPTAGQAIQGSKQNIQAQLPHYELGGRKGSKAIRAYADLQDDMARRGVKTARGRAPRVKSTPSSGRTRRFAVDSKGTAVQKSAFGISHGDR